MSIETHIYLRVAALFSGPVLVFFLLFLFQGHPGPISRVVGDDCHGNSLRVNCSGCPVVDSAYLTTLLQSLNPEVSVEQYDGIFNDYCKDESKRDEFWEGQILGNRVKRYLVSEQLSEQPLRKILEHFYSTSGKPGIGRFLVLVFFLFLSLFFTGYSLGFLRKQVRSNLKKKQLLRADISIVLASGAIMVGLVQHTLWPAFTLFNQPFLTILIPAILGLLFYATNQLMEFIGDEPDPRSQTTQSP